jgi:hypothetical protein
MSSDSLQVRSTPASVKLTLAKLTLAKLLGHYIQDRELRRYLVTGCKFVAWRIPN